LLQSPNQSFDFDLARAEFQALVTTSDAYQEGEDEGTKRLPFDTVIGLPDSPSSPFLTNIVDSASRYANRLGASLKASPQGHAFMNGKHADIGEVSSRFFYKRWELTDVSGFSQHSSSGNCAADTVLAGAGT
jgi:hypothetical protein